MRTELVDFYITFIYWMSGVSLPSLIFMGVGAMTDFGPLIANPKSFLLGAAAQFGIYGAYFMAIFMGFNDKAAAAISIIGGADGPTSIFLAGKLGQTGLMGPIAVAAYSYMALVPIIQPPIMKLLTTKEESVDPVWSSFVRYPNWRRFCSRLLLQSLSA